MEAIAANILLEGLAVNALAQCKSPVTLVTTDSRELSLIHISEPTRH